MAPMAGVTDRPFRSIVKRMGAAVTCTEMVSVNGLFYNSSRGQALREIGEEERPAAIQFFGDSPEILEKVVPQYSQDFDIIDINMGCPAPKIVKGGQGSALMRDPQRAEKLVRTLVRCSEKPVTVKIRRGWDEEHVNGVEFALRMQDAGAAMVAVHGRTREQMYMGEADWDYIARVKAALDIPVLGNGDLFDAPTALRRMTESGVDGVMIARGAEGNPWIFRDFLAMSRGEACPQPPSAEEKYRVAMEHAGLLCEQRGERNAVPPLRKHMGWYLKGMRNVASARNELNQATTLAELGRIMRSVLLEKD